MRLTASQPAEFKQAEQQQQHGEGDYYLAITETMSVGSWKLVLVLELELDRLKHITEVEPDPKVEESVSEQHSIAQHSTEQSDVE